MIPMYFTAEEYHHLKRYSQDHCCSKCGRGATNKFVRVDVRQYCGALLCTQEAPPRTCCGCGFVWYELPLDAPHREN